ncbi:MAG: SUMF1/EgtB/PvdO family nonheme iron enzyme [Rhodocyclaceae bacterium]|nr:SUMF1/EgtB/PvdO family nonheme iron enzyme [Rhodocyclaceae bacterium]
MSRAFTTAELHAALDDARARLLAIYSGLPPALWQAVPYLRIINPPRWEIGHVAWFAERWCLRRQNGGFAPSRFLADADRWYDSGNVEHTTRWTLDLPGLAATRAYLANVLDATHAALDAGDVDAYFFQLALYHEDMHCEALQYTLQTLGVPLPADARLAACPLMLGEGGELWFPGGEVEIGSSENADFVFDNEKWAHAVTLPPFAIDRRPVSNADYLAFVEDGGYARPEWWSETGRQWLADTGRKAPRYWRRGAQGWERRAYGAWLPLAPGEPVLHVSAFEAEAWCAWAGRRLPAEEEWECAAKTFGDAFSPWGHAWQWTASPFAPYAGFSPDPYADYSQPWFHTHRAVRGGSFATTARLLDPVFRNFYEPQRDDIFVGFRSARDLIVVPAEAGTQRDPSKDNGFPLSRE